jgi:Vacuolar-sorting-associated 13 protein C-terminal
MLQVNLSFTKNADLKELFKLIGQKEQEQVAWEWEQGHIGVHNSSANNSFASSSSDQQGSSSTTVNHSLISNLPRLLGQFAINLTNDISTSAVRLNGMEISHLCKTRRQLVRTLQAHYIGALLRQLYKIVGSFDFLGDPLGALR